MKRMHDKKQLACEVTEEEFEELVRATPTDCRLVENEGKLQLQLEHDTQVLSIDTDFGNTLISNFNNRILTNFKLTLIGIIDQDIGDSSYDIDFLGLCLSNGYIKENSFSALGLADTSFSLIPTIIKDNANPSINNIKTFISSMSFTSSGCSIYIQGLKYFDFTYEQLAELIDGAEIHQFNNPYYIEI